ncbi:MAG TPA: cytochrome c oxidase subunit II [Thermoanaerobaculia bacterium]|nr:cytochrome c oxidase subunit II [Thermoanaerobaculia bacterium]
MHFFPEEASTFARHVDSLYLFLIAVTAFFSLMIGVLVVVFAIKYRRKSADEVATEVHESGVLEIVWTVIPFGIVMIMFFWGARVFFQITRPPQNAIDVYVTAKQWMWKLQHADGHREMNELHVPIGQPVRLTMASEDVIHSFYVPAFRFKRDVVPGRFSVAWFEATKPGKYHLFCAEYCGTRHSNMIGWVYVMTPADYQAWLAGGAPGETLAASGAKRFVENACNTCHGDQPGARGPSLTGLFGRRVQLSNGQTIVADEGYIRESIVNPQAKLVAGYPAIMPTFQGLISEEGLLQLVAYIKSLSAPPPAGAAAVPAAAPSQTPPAPERKVSRP